LDFKHKNAGSNQSRLDNMEVIRNDQIKRTILSAIKVVPGDGTASMFTGKMEYSQQLTAAAHGRASAATVFFSIAQLHMRIISRISGRR
jgi:hypothetical protein